jgi:hypothetical protein
MKTSLKNMVKCVAGVVVVLGSVGIAVAGSPYGGQRVTQAQQSQVQSVQQQYRPVQPQYPTQATQPVQPVYYTYTVPVAPVRHGSAIVTVDNESGEPALVRLVGPTANEVYINSGWQGTFRNLAAGRYVIRVRYGFPGHYRYTEGDAFDVMSTATTYSRIAITLHAAAEGNYAARPISSGYFAATAP